MSNSNKEEYTNIQSYAQSHLLLKLIPTLFPLKCLILEKCYLKLNDVNECSNIFELKKCIQDNINILTGMDNSSQSDRNNFNTNISSLGKLKQVYTLLKE